MAERSSTIGLAAVLAASTTLAVLAAPNAPGVAQEGPVGPCSPYRAADGDIPSEMPGCARRRRVEAGSLEDELRFRRSRADAAADDGTAPDDGAPPRRRPHRAPRHAPERPR